MACAGRDTGSWHHELPGNGAVAQLGERELCKLEVIGSIPFSSTNLRPAPEQHEARSEGTRVLSLLSSGREFIDIVEDDLRGQ